MQFSATAGVAGLTVQCEVSPSRSGGPSLPSGGRMTVQDCHRHMFPPTFRRRIARKSPRRGQATRTGQIGPGEKGPDDRDKSSGSSCRVNYKAASVNNELRGFQFAGTVYNDRTVEFRRRVTDTLPASIRVCVLALSRAIGRIPLRLLPALVSLH